MASLTHRRQFIKQTASVLSAPFIASGWIKASPNSKLRHAAIGLGGQGGSDLSVFSSHPNFELVAGCDTDTNAINRVQQSHPNARLYKDWRELFEKEAKNIDSVSFSTPDHMHAAIGLAAIDLKKHVYGQKPLTQTIRECRLITEKARAAGVKTQMGIQISSDSSERLTVALIQSGVIGQIKEVHSFSSKKWGDDSDWPAEDRKDEVPANLDWDLWLGVAEDRPYLNGYYHPANWRKRREFGTGTLGDMGCHMFSGWYRSLALTAPISVHYKGKHINSPHNWATNGLVEYVFPGTKYTADKTVKVTWYDGDNRPPQELASQLDGIAIPDQGSLYIGTEGIVVAGHGSTPRLIPLAKFKGHPYPKLEHRNHYHEFIDRCLDGKGQPSANFDYSGPMTEAVLLGCLASLVPDKELLWDAKNLRFTNSPEATALVSRPYRKGWEIKGI